jgi:hypothetical protein
MTMYCTRILDILALNGFTETQTFGEGVWKRRGEQAMPKPTLNKVRPVYADKNIVSPEKPDSSVL